jgi:hypothetical protein
MLRDFVVTRYLLVLGAVALLLLVAIRSEDPEQTRGADLVVDAARSDQSDRPEGPTWEEELLAPDIQALWLERRLLLDDLSNRYLAEIDQARRESLRHEMEHIIERSEREVYDLRVQNARRSGNDALVTWLERARDRLPENPPDAETTGRP